MTHKYLPFIIIPFVIILLLPFLSPNIIGTDVYYNFKSAQNLLNFQINNNLAFTFLPNNLNHHFLLHIIYLPFTLFNLTLGVKLFNLIMALLLISTFWWLSKKLTIKYPLLWLFILFISSSIFLLRINLGRSPVISIIFLFLIFYSLIENKNRLIFLLSFFYTWLFNGFILIFFLLTPFIFFNLIYKKPWFKIVLSSLLGLITGLVINPFFPLNIYFFIKQIAFIAIGNTFIKNIPVGIEWSSYPIINFISDNIILLLLIIYLVILFFIFKINKQFNHINFKDKLIIFILGIAVVCFLFLSIKSKKFIEYLAPFTVLLTAFTFTLFFRSAKSAEFLTLINNLKNKLQKPLFKLFLIIAVISLIIIPYKTVYLKLTTAHPINRYQQTAEWLKNNTPAYSTVFNASWDSYPRLYFYNNHNFYLVGLDPLYMYHYNKDFYWLWRNITEKSIACTTPTDDIDLDNLITSDCSENQQSPEMIATTIKTQFNSEYIWIDDYPIHQDFKKFLENNQEYFEKMIETNDSSVFRIIN